MICDIEALLDAIDIADYIGQYLDLEERNGELWGLSPFNEEMTPSFSVNPDHQCFFDFSAGFGGTVIGFAMRYHKVSKAQAIKMLMAFAGMTEDSTYQDRHLQSSKIMKRYKPVKSNRKQLKIRTLPAGYIDRFEDDPSKYINWTAEGISKDTLALFSVRYDPFSNRLVFPVRDMLGNVINVIGRTLDPEFKKKGLAKYQPYMEFGAIDTIAGYWENRVAIHEAREIILFEGLKSVMLCHTWGIHNCGAIMTSHLSPLLLRRLIGLGVKVVFALDKGVNPRADRNIAKLLRFTKVAAVMDSQNLLEEKMAPVDRRYDVWKSLYRDRHSLN